MVSVMNRIGFVSIVALVLCTHFVSASEEEFDTQQYIEQLAREASGAYSTAADAATKALKAEQDSMPSAEELIDKCVCEKRATAGDPCAEGGLDDQDEKKLRTDFFNACEQELQHMPGPLKDELRNQCIQRKVVSAGLEWKDPQEEVVKQEARDYIQKTCEQTVSQSMKPREIKVVEDPEAVILKCMCARTNCRTDEEQLVIEEGIEEITKSCKKQVAMQVAEAMGEGNEGMSKEEMSAAIEKCACEARAETDDPCMSEDEIETKKADLKEIQQACRKPLHDEL